MESRGSRRTRDGTRGASGGRCRWGPAPRSTWLGHANPSQRNWEELSEEYFKGTQQGPEDLGRGPGLPSPHQSIPGAAVKQGAQTRPQGWGGGLRTLLEIPHPDYPGLLITWGRAGFPPGSCFLLLLNSLG